MGRRGVRAVARGRSAAIALLTAACLTASTSTVAAGAVPPAPPVLAGEQEPTADQVRSALQQALDLHAAVTDQARTVDEARAGLTASAADAALALEAYGQAAALRDTAAAEATRREVALAATGEAVDDGRAGLARWARQAYQDGGSLGTSSPFVWTVLAGGSTDDAATNQAWVERAGADRTEALRRLRAAQAAQEAAVEQARHASDLAEAAAAQAAAASRARDAVLAEHRARLADLETLLAGSRASADQADARASRLAQAWGEGGGAGRVAGAGVGAGLLLADVPAGPGDADCPGGDVSGYPNGHLPLDALCPLREAAGLLRADAAAAFDRMSVAFQARFGRPLCVTDAYRSYDEQVRVRAERGSWAAVPGRSTHGWGTALDLCGGIEDFASPARAWLVLNGPLSGWFPPVWARRGGPLPEPWHWEFAGQGR